MSTGRWSSRGVTPRGDDSRVSGLLGVESWEYNMIEYSGGDDSDWVPWHGRRRA